MHITAIFPELAVTAPAAWAWLLSQWQSFSANTGSALITSIWESAVIACSLEISLRLAPRISAAHRFASWAAGFTIALALPFLPLVHFGGNSVAAMTSNSAAAPASPHALLQLDARWGFALAAVWLIASLIRATALAVHSVRLRRLWKSAQPIEISNSLALELNSVRSGNVTICTTKVLDRPSVIGFLSPRILIPDWLLARLTPAELQQIVLHEAEHLRRCDDWTNLLQKLCLIVFPLNPALAWIENRLCREREIACDEGVVRITNAPRAYAACLASLAERHLERRAEALSLGAWHRRSELVDRVHRILIHKRTMSATAAGALLATLGCMLIAGSVEMSRLPQLVAFVPKQNVQALTPARQVQLDALLAHENAESKPHLPATYRAVPAKAILPDQRSTPSTHTHRHTAAPSTPEIQTAANSAVTAQQIAASELLGDRVVSSKPQSQQWVVVTTWREITPSTHVPQTISDFDGESEPAIAPSPAHGAQNTTSSTETAANAAGTTAANTPTRSPSSKNQTAPAAHQFTFTQLILRVVPGTPGSTSTQPTTTAPPQAITVRDGWFVIQL